MDIKQALEVVEHGVADGFLKPGTKLVTTDKGTKQVVDPDGTVIATAFDWKPALTQALKPGMDAYEVKVREHKAQFRKDTAAFMAFLMDKYSAEFKEWRKTNDPDSNGSGNEPDQKQLVQVVPS